VSEWTGRPGDRGSIPGRGKRIFPLSSMSRPDLGPTQPPVQWVLRVLSPVVKAGGDADQSPPLSVEVMNEQELYLLSALLLHGSALHHIRDLKFSRLEDVHSGFKVCGTVWNSRWTPTYKSTQCHNPRTSPWIFMSLFSLRKSYRRFRSIPRLYCRGGQLDQLQ
jgi:hypothetical protein